MKRERKVVFSMVLPLVLMTIVSMAGVAPAFAATTVIEYGSVGSAILTQLPGYTVDPAIPPFVVVLHDEKQSTWGAGDYLFLYLNNRPAIWATNNQNPDVHDMEAIGGPKQKYYYLSEDDFKAERHGNSFSFDLKIPLSTISTKPPVVVLPPLHIELDQYGGNVREVATAYPPTGWTATREASGFRAVASVEYTTLGVEFKSLGTIWMHQTLTWTPPP